MTILQDPTFRPDTAVTIQTDALDLGGVVQLIINVDFNRSGPMNGWTRISWQRSLLL